MLSKVLALLSLAVTAAHALPSNPGCANLDPHQCVALALTAMGGSDKLAALHSVRLDIIADTALMEQSYRQAPFIHSYERDRVTIDLAHQRISSMNHVVWPESDLGPKNAESDSTVIVTPAGGVHRSPAGDTPCSPADIESVKQTLALGSERLLLTAAAAANLHFAPSEILRSTPHTVVAFTWNRVPVRILLNAFNHLPDAVDTTQQFKDFWSFWGDVKQRVYFDNWKLLDGVSYPTNQITERNGALWRSTQVLDFEFNPAIDNDNKLFAMDAKAAAQSAQPRSTAPYRLDNAKRVQLAPGIDFFPGPWNATLVKQTDGIVILETPISARYTEGLFAKARELYPGAPIKAALSTSDSWPHTGGVRYDVSQSIPVYILDLNQPLLDRMMTAPHTLEPDPLQLSRQPPRWKIVSAKTEVGSGANRMVLYPLRGASTERQYMVYFPEHRLLYASDTLVLNSDNSLYDPELMHEVAQAVAREGLTVETVFAMHQGPTPWAQVITLLRK